MLFNAIQALSVEPKKEWMDLDALLEYLPNKYTKATIYTWVDKRQIPFHKKGKKLYFNRADINEWLREDKRRFQGNIRLAS